MPNLHETLKSLQIPSMTGIALRPAAADPSSIIYPIFKCIADVSVGQSVKAAVIVPSEAKKGRNDVRFTDWKADQVLFRSELVAKELQGQTKKHDNAFDVIAVVVKDNFFPCRDPVASSPFVVSPHIIIQALAHRHDRDSDSVTRFSFKESNVDQTPLSSAATSGEVKSLTSVTQYRQAGSMLVHASEKRIRSKKKAEKHQKQE